jgi:hypothetical protein
MTMRARLLLRTLTLTGVVLASCTVATGVAEVATAPAVTPAAAPARAPRAPLLPAETPSGPDPVVLALDLDLDLSGAASATSTDAAPGAPPHRRAERHIARVPTRPCC